MKIAALRIPCLDVAAAAEFYEHKLGLTRIFGSPEEGFVGFALENATLLLEPAELGEYEAGGYRGFSLAVQDIDAFYKAALERGVAFTHPPLKQPWGGMMTHVSDEDGNIFSIVEAE